MKKFIDGRFRVAIGLLVLALILGGVIWSVMTPSTPTPTPPTCCTKPPVTPPTPTPPPVEPPVVPTVETEQIIEAIAWCDHSNLWGPFKQHLAVFSRRDDIEVNLVEVRHNGQLLASCPLWRETPNKMRLYGAFPEGLHGTELEVTVYYTVRGKFGIRFLHKSIVHCVIEKT